MEGETLSRSWGVRSEDLWVIGEITDWKTDYGFLHLHLFPEIEILEKFSGSQKLKY